MTYPVYTRRTIIEEIMKEQKAQLEKLKEELNSEICPELRKQIDMKAEKETR
jgi:hypothetical protein